MTLKTIEEHNGERRILWRLEQWIQKARIRPRMIQCPQCPGTLEYGSTFGTSDDSPPEQYVSCPDCDWRGSILA